MKKVLIVQDNLKMGGIQKALINALRVAPQDEYDITLLLFYKDGPLLKELPNGIKVISCGKRYSILGKTKSELRETKLLFLLKSFLHIWSRLFNRKSAMRLLGIGKKKLKGYDYAISYAHPFHKKILSGGAAEFVLSNVKAKEKICFIHCDYLNSGTRSKYNDKLFLKFDKIACVSDSVKANFLKALPTLSDKAYMVRNVVLQDEIIAKANENPFEYDQSVINILTVARLGKEKGINRMISALGKSGKKNFHYYVVGGGPLFEQLQSQIVELGLLDRVTLLGEDTNPYRYMKNADLLAVPSYHEAAPVVFQEAMILGLPVFTTKTSSAEEMVGNFGFVCENEDDEIEKTIKNLLDDPKQIVEKNKIIGLEYSFDKNKAKKEFEELIK